MLFKKFSSEGIVYPHRFREIAVQMWVSIMTRTVGYMERKG